MGDAPIWDEPEGAVSDYDKASFAQAFNAGVRRIAEAGRKHGREPRKVAEAVWVALTGKRPRIRYAPPPHPLFEQFPPSVTPCRIVDATLKRALGLRPGASSRVRS